MTFAVADTDTREIIAVFAAENIARFAAASISGVTHRPLSLVKTARLFTFGKAADGLPLARFLDGEELAATAVIRPLVPPPGT